MNDVRTATTRRLNQVVRLIKGGPFDYFTGLEDVFGPGYFTLATRSCLFP